MVFPRGSDGKESPCNAGELGLFLGLGRFPAKRHGNLLQYSCLKNAHGQRSLAGCNPWIYKESDTAEQQSTAEHDDTGKPIIVSIVDMEREWF